MNAARLDRSPRLQRIRAFLSDGNWRSTRDIVMGAGVMAVNSCIAELRANGMTVETRCTGRGRYEYRMGGGQLSCL